MEPDRNSNLREYEEPLNKMSSSKVLSKKPLAKSTSFVKTVTLAEKYKIAWKKVYFSLPDWRKKEIDKQMESGKLSDREWDTDFAQRVASLAEKL